MIADATCGNSEKGSAMAAFGARRRDD